MRQVALLALAASLLHLAQPGMATDVVIYRCTDAAGQLTLQNEPCGAGMHEEKRTVSSVNTVPMDNLPARPATPSPAAPPVPATQAGSAVLDTAAAPSSPPEAPPPAENRLPPPVIFSCTAPDTGGSYITESDQPQSRCVPLRTVGLDGNPQTGAGQACEIVHDVCARVPDEQLCETWRKRLSETEVAWRFGRAENAAKNRAEFERVQRILAESTCSGP
ncbi:hypothetical protein CSC70_03090 [Pseudoxanthomonas kalamensis DSM 18571]|uniref:DUF4124 domain-containing protein n=1 Tax=Pseudoxanthomonas kalamensis TaxID=289483 RepID=UPI0013917535|nr:DUF4124 domain-containing protein [Pseudoxanthomonas kalamensis]KAF1712513.1 hypothetical protein CSC70_03090 [Pseudoxanthomonas kalamensis DSM 18571]